MKRYQEQAAKESGWPNVMDEIATELGLQSSWMPDGPLKGESALVEALIRSELVPNSITYSKETYRARRRVYVEDQVRTFFQTLSHVSRVATEIMRGIDDINAVSSQTDTRHGQLHH